MLKNLKAYIRTIGPFSRFLIQNANKYTNLNRPLNKTVIFAGRGSAGQAIEDTGQGIEGTGQGIEGTGRCREMHEDEGKMQEGTRETQE